MSSAKHVKFLPETQLNEPDGVRFAWRKFFVNGQDYNLVLPISNNTLVM